jgi:hypothetical protein
MISAAANCSTESDLLDHRMFRLQRLLAQRQGREQHRAMNARNVALTSGIGTFEICRMRRAMSEFEGKAENICSY